MSSTYRLVAIAQMFQRQSFRSVAASTFARYIARFLVLDFQVAKMISKPK